MAPLSTPTTPTVNFADFVERVEARLVSYLRFTTGSAAEAEDLFQETMLKIHQDWPNVVKKDRPEAWVFTVARNMAMNRLKRMGIERRALGEIAEDPSPRVPRPVEKEEARTIVRHALATLPEDQREAVSLKIWGECTWVEIGRALGVSDDTAARLFARGLKAIAPQLKKVAP